MNIKLDENVPMQVASLLRDLNHDVHTLREEQLTGRTDEEVWNAAQRESRFLITQDLDFSDVRRFSPGSHHGILLMRLHTPNRRNLISRIRELFTQENAGEWTGCFVVATERKVRVLKPKN